MWNHIGNVYLGKKGYKIYDLKKSKKKKAKTKNTVTVNKKLMIGEVICAHFLKSVLWFILV